MKSFIDFFTFEYVNIKYVVLGVLLLAISSSAVGVFNFVKKKSLVSDVISHSVLPGICISFMLVGYKDPFLILAGAFVSGWLSVYLMDYIILYSKITKDTATGLILSVFFGGGILLMTHIQHSGAGGQSGLDTFLFGNAATIVANDVLVFGTVAIVVIITVLAFYKEFKLIAFDTLLSKSLGLPVKRYEGILTSITVLAVVTGIQAVGVVLMSSLLIAPAAAARYWSDRLSIMILLAAIFGSVAGVSGAYISYLEPNIPTGPWIVIVITLIAFFSFAFSPKKGFVAALWRRWKIRIKVRNENILKLFYKINENDNDLRVALDINELHDRDKIQVPELKKGLFSLLKKQLVYKQNNTWGLTKKGLEDSKKLTRLHRLWELYLTSYLKLPSDHVHEEAETIEHIITPEIEAQLETILNNPTHDPHQSVIPK